MAFRDRLLATGKTKMHMVGALMHKLSRVILGSWTFIMPPRISGKRRKLIATAVPLAPHRCGLSGYVVNCARAEPPHSQRTPVIQHD